MGKRGVKKKVQAEDKTVISFAKYGYKRTIEILNLFFGVVEIKKGQIE